MSSAAPWWREAVCYEVYVPSFCRAGPPGPGRGLPNAGDRPAGDLDGIRSRLEHLEWLGVDVIWLTPFYPSPLADFGYDVADYCDVNPLFGTLDDFDALLADAHSRGIRVIADWVPNHTSSEHPWFREARASRSSPKRDWYVWRDGDPSTPPNNWTASFVGGPAWTWDEATGAWYLHLFLPEQPDLNWANPEVEAAMTDVLRFWLDRGIDGFRIDVVHGIGKDAALPDAPEATAAVPWSAQNDHESTHGILRRLRRVVDSYPGERFLVGEVFLLSTHQVAAYYGYGDELHLAFNFPPLFAPWEAPAWRRRVERAEEELNPRGAWPTWVLSNHDNPRHRTRYGSEGRARAAAVLLLTLRGTPFLYQGEELGLEDAVVPRDRQVDPGGRDGCRAPVPWEPGPSHGWMAHGWMAHGWMAHGWMAHGWMGAGPDGTGSHERDLWLPWPPEADVRNAASERADPGSMLHLYRRVLALRRASPALRRGSWEELPAPDQVLAFRRREGEDHRVVLVNYSDREVDVREVDVAGPGATVQVSSLGIGEGDAFSGRLRADEAVILGRG